MPIVEPAELLGHITTSDGRQIPHYKVKTETTLTHVDTGAEYNSEAEAQADIDNPGTSTTAEKIRRDVKVFAPSLADMLGETPEQLYIAANLDDCALIIKDFLPLDLFKSVSNYDYNSRSSSLSARMMGRRIGPIITCTTAQPGL